MKRIRLGLVLMALLVPGIAKAQVGVYAAFSAAKLNAQVRTGSTGQHLGRTTMRCICRW